MEMPVFDGAYLYAPEISPKQEVNILKKQLQDIHGRIETLEKVQAEKSE